MNSTTNQPSLLELAKQGNAKAIAALMNRQLQPKGITAKVAVKDGYLQIMLESVQVPNQQALVAFVHKGITGLGAASIKKVKVYGCQAGSAMPAWRQEFELAQQQLSPNSTAAQSVTTTTRETRNKLIAKTQLKAISLGNIILDWVNLSAKPFAINASQKFEQLPKLPKIGVIGTSAVLLTFGVNLLANPNPDYRFNKELYTLLESSTNPDSVTTQKNIVTEVYGIKKAQEAGKKYCQLLASGVSKDESQQEDLFKLVNLADEGQITSEEFAQLTIVDISIKMTAEKVYCPEYLDITQKASLKDRFSN
jgi:hypothetical protein